MNRATAPNAKGSQNSPLTPKHVSHLANRRNWKSEVPTFCIAEPEVFQPHLTVIDGPTLGLQDSWSRLTTFLELAKSGDSGSRTRGVERYA